MEGRSHSSAAFVAAGNLSRMKEDLLNCSRDLLASFQPREAVRAREDAPKRLHIGVIGAGLAGLRCAEVLIDGGARVTVLEARDRIGGRVSWNRLVIWPEGRHRNPKVVLLTQAVLDTPVQTA
jgi:heterodisulfide reductase subunit A-like polyferredoxin